MGVRDVYGRTSLHFAVRRYHKDVDCPMTDQTGLERSLRDGEMSLQSRCRSFFILTVCHSISDS